LNHVPSRETRHWLAFGIGMAISIVVFHGAVGELIRFGLENDDASHILLIPLISAGLIFMEREKIFQKSTYDVGVGAVFLVLAAGLYALMRHASGGWSPNDRMAAYSLTLVLCWTGIFVGCFGRRASQAAKFSLLFLFLMVPLPDFLLNPIVYFLQKGSAELTAMLFDLLGVPFLRQGFVFHLARVSIEVAKECSGIRSSMALLILALLLVHFSLRATWRKIVFVVGGILVMIVKNAIRIVTLTLLASYVNPEFLFGRLHREGGVVFFLLGLALLAPLLWLLQRGERRSLEASKAQQTYNVG
jgi:exosortase